MNPFVDGEERFCITIRYEKQKSGAIAIVRKNNVTNAHSLSTTWRRLNYEQIAEASSQSLQFSQNGEGFIDWVKHRYLIIRSALIGWDIEGVPCTPETISQLDPEVASELIEQYLRITIPDRNHTDEEKASLEDRVSQLENAVLTLIEERKKRRKKSKN